MKNKVVILYMFLCLFFPALSFSDDTTVTKTFDGTNWIFDYQYTGSASLSGQYLSAGLYLPSIVTSYTDPGGVVPMVFTGLTVGNLSVVWNNDSGQYDIANDASFGIQTVALSDTHYQFVVSPSSIISNDAACANIDNINNTGGLYVGSGSPLTQSLMDGASFFVFGVDSNFQYTGVGDFGSSSSYQNDYSYNGSSVSSVSVSSGGSWPSSSSGNSNLTPFLSSASSSVSGLSAAVVAILAGVVLIPVSYVAYGFLKKGLS